MLTQFPLFSGDVGFYFLFLVGNGSWALFHVWNYRNVDDQHWFRVLPQFIGGIFFTIIFVKYGLLAAILSHFACNAVLFAFDKKQRTDHIDMGLVAIAALFTVAMYELIGSRLSDVKIWFEPTLESFALPGWSLWDYVFLTVFVEASANLLFGMLLYDRSNVGAALKEKGKEKSYRGLHPLTFLISVAIIFVVVMGLILGALYGAFALLGYVFSDVPTRILMLGIGITMLSAKSSSLSAMSRTFWSSLPCTYVFLCALQSLSFSSGLAFILLVALLGAPANILRSYDD